VLAGATPADWRSAFYYQYFEYPTPHRVRPHYGVITERYKLVRFDGIGESYWELFDLLKDPGEMKSVYGEPAYESTTADLKRELTRLRRDLKVPDTVPASWYGSPPGGPNGPQSKAKKGAIQNSP
jgi:hypothetical protein